MNKNEMIQALEDILMLNPGELKEDSILKDYEDWDSLAFLNLMALFDSKFNMNITSEEISNLKTVNDILKLAKII
ncbi:acyl carrier protein [Campylobacter armoricus]|uniref:Acyl carrier protein n=1 Tax=Campylobacter armoricus TaxID=2505970 RepID=A0A7L5HLT0_9BACT|nr:acyl carrier protein [Campylobacter armoricus]QKF80198.1 acyl carrier protein [Campylobacter armoricus]